MLPHPEVPLSYKPSSFTPAEGEMTENAPVPQVTCTSADQKSESFASYMATLIAVVQEAQVLEEDAAGAVQVLLKAQLAGWEDRAQAFSFFDNTYLFLENLPHCEPEFISNLRRIIPEGRDTDLFELLSPVTEALHEFIFAERLFELGNVAQKDAQLKAVDRSDLNSRERVLGELESLCARFCEAHQVTVYGLDESELREVGKEGDAEELHWNLAELLKISSHAEPSIVIPLGSEGFLRSDERLSEALTTLRSERFEQSFERKLGFVDAERLARETEQYGAKGAGVRALGRAVPGINAVLRDLDFGLQVSVPPSRSIALSVAERALQQPDQCAELQSIFTWAKDRDVIIRSSALRSEDGSTHTGAGRYQSVRIPCCSTFEEFSTALTTVLRSVDSPSAILYRAETGVEQERMTATVQYFVDREHSYFKGPGYMNTVRAGVPEILEIIHGESTRALLYRAGIEKGIPQNWLKGDIPGLYHYQVDQAELYPLSAQGLAVVAHLVERHFRAPLQIEYVLDNSTVHLIQQRRLPPSFLQRCTVTFPKDETSIFDGIALGSGDMELDVLPMREENRSKRGVVVFESSFWTSDQGPERYFPKEGAVVVRGQSVPGGGHVETLALEKGLLCVTSAGSESRFMADARAQYSRRLNQIHILDSWQGFRRVRVVADGLNAKIYGVQES